MLDPLGWEVNELSEEHELSEESTALRDDDWPKLIVPGVALLTPPGTRFCYRL
jgi:hypothetical protein